MTATAAAGPAQAFSNSGHSTEIRAKAAFESKEFNSIRRRVALEGCKWDAQVGDITTLAPFPLVLRRSTWRQLAGWAEQLASEAAEAESEISHRPELLSKLGLPRSLLNILASEAPATPAAGRVFRFDFHFTTAGWLISEANSDVPGGFSEASLFTSLVGRHYPHLSPAGNPGEQWAEALATSCGSGAVALLSAPGYMEDHQVVSFVASELRHRGCKVQLGKPEQLRWRDGHAHLQTSWHCGPVDAIVRFYQAEWICRLPQETNWSFLFRRGLTPVANPALSVITESKRFPLVWNKLAARLPTWRALLPETADPREVNWPGDEDWLIKMALSNTGDTVSIRELMRPAQWFETRLRVLAAPHRWVAQRRFQSLPIATPIGPRHVCIGVYTINGQAAGVYARLGIKPLIDFAAIDVALLIEEDD